MQHITFGTWRPKMKRHIKLDNVCTVVNLSILNDSSVFLRMLPTCFAVIAAKVQISEFYNV